MSYCRDITSRQIPIYHPYHDYIDRMFDWSPSFSWLTPFHGFWDNEQQKDYSIYIDVGRDYKPEDVTSKIENGKLKVSGKAHRSDKTGTTSHEFNREFDLPKDIKLDTMKTQLDNYGGLTVTFKRTHKESKPEFEDLSDKNKYHYRLNVEGFSPEEISVSNIGGNSVLVEGKHHKEHTSEDGTSHFTQSGHYQRRIYLGNDLREDTLKGKFSKDGSLEIFADRDTKRVKPGEKKLHIEYEK